MNDLSYQDLAVVATYDNMEAQNIVQHYLDPNLFGKRNIIVHCSSPALPRKVVARIR